MELEKFILQGKKVIVYLPRSGMDSEMLGDSLSEDGAPS